MAFDLMNLQKNKISRDLRSYMAFWYGNPKTGKSTICSKIYGDEALWICTEKGYSALSIFAVDFTSWNEANGLLRQLKMPEVKDRFKTVIIDTVDILYSLCQEFVIKTNGVQALTDKPYGQLFAVVDKLFNEFILGITRLGYNLVFIGHAKSQSKLAKSGKNERETDYTIPSLAKRGYQIVANLVDNIFYVTIDQNEDGDRVRVIKTRETDEYFAGSRFQHMPESILLDADTIIKEMQCAIDKEENTTEEKKDLFVKQTKVDFEDVLSKLTELVTNVFAPNDEMAKVTKVVEYYLGIGNRVADATEEQADALQLILDELIIFAEEKGLK